VQVGKSVGTDKKVGNQTTEFGVRDTMYVAVVTEGAAKDAKVTAKWTFNGTQVVKESSQTISPTGGETVTEFHVDKKSAWPKGKYKVDVSLNGVAAGSKDLEVK
jgi:flagellar hook assembly protein FlgD